MSEIDPCIVCGSVEADQRYASTFDGTLQDAPDYFLAHRKASAHGRIVRCCGCGFVFTSPRFADGDYDSIYRNIPVPHAGDAKFDAAKTARFHRLSAIFRRHIPYGRHFVDFGCGDGAFLREIDDDAGLGFEIGSPGRLKAGRSKVLLGNWSDVAGSSDMPAASFEAVTSFDVLEHLPRIKDDVALVRSLLKPGGLFFVSVPNVESRIARLMGKRWNMLLLEHLWYFSPTLLSQFMEHNGFKEKSIRNIPFDAPIAHIATRLAQTFGMKGAFAPIGLTNISLPVPAGIMLGIYEAI